MCVSAGDLALRRYGNHGNQRAESEMLGNDHHLFLVRLRLYSWTAHDNRGNLRCNHKQGGHAYFLSFFLYIILICK